MNIGKFKLTVIETPQFGLDGGAMFGVVPKTLWTRAYQEPDEKNRIPLTARLLVVEWDDKKMLLDTGLGDKFDEKFAKIYGVDKSQSSIELALQKKGFKTEDITDVVLTHLHFDHVGGATKFDSNGNVIPTFENAKYYVQKDQYEWALNPSIKDRASFINDNYVPLKEEGLIEFTDGEGELFPGVSMLPINGHTKGQQMIKLHDDNKSLLYLADLAPTTAHIMPAYGMGYDNTPLDTIAEKEKYFPTAFDEKSIIFFEHDAFTEACYLEENPRGGFIAGEKIKISD